MGKLGATITLNLNNHLANFVGDNLQLNNIFDLTSPSNRDGCLEPYSLLKQKFLNEKIEINTSDVNYKNNPLFELHLDVQKKINDKVPCYVILFEAPQIKADNNDKTALEKYRRIFTWRDDLVDNEKYIKLNLPNIIIVNRDRGWYNREKLCCMIAGNKSLKHKSSLDLYVERLNTIRWFEKNAPTNFDLFGKGWNKPSSKPSLLGKIINCLIQYNFFSRRKKFFPSYQGSIISKVETLKKYRFSICYENIKDLPGYITEKIFDSFFAGCIPIYWGASNINSYIPEDCFIDRRKFSDHKSLYDFMIGMTESEFIAYQERIATFLKSEQAQLFHANTFTEIIVNKILSDV